MVFEISVPLASILIVIIASISLAYFLYIFFLGQLNKDERKKIIMIFILFIGAALF